MDRKELLDYLCHLSAVRTSISRGIFLLRQLEESEEALIEAFSLRSLRPHQVSSGTGLDTDRFHIMIQENCNREKEELYREKQLIFNRIRRDKQIVTAIEVAICTLPEPMREICILRYINKFRWNDVQRETGRSPAGVYKIHREALQMLENKLCTARSENRMYTIAQSPV